MGRKREGASLIYVIIIFMFVSIVSVSMLSMVSANYRGRVVENKRIENLYGADSGIDVAYNIIGKTFDAASMYGYFCRKELFDNKKGIYSIEYKNIQDDIIACQNKIIAENKNDNPNQATINNAKAQIQKDNEKLELILNEEFKIAFANFIQEKSSDTNSEEMLKYCLKNGKYVNSVIGIGIDKFKTVSINYPNSQPDLSGSEVVLSKSSSNKDDVEINKYSFDISVISNFESNTNVAIGTNTRTIKANYKLKVPNYEDVFFGKRSTTQNKYLALEDRVLTIGEDMNIENANKVNFNGDIFVNGQEPSIGSNNDNRTYVKYSGGIILNDISNDIKFNGDVITRNTFNVQNNIKATITGNLYARNLYVGKDEEFANNSILNLDGTGQAILDNDLTMRANTSSIILKDFYGINDKNINPSATGNIGKSSSSIIINKNDKQGLNSTVKIINSAYIMGTAHIATTNNYQTGESGAVKGNYEAYSVPDPTDNSEVFEYDNPLYLLKESDVFKKADHFKNYWSQNGKTADDGGIIWPDKDKIYSIGAIVYKRADGTSNILRSTYNADLENSDGEIYTKREEFASKVYKFGQKADINEYNNTVQTNFSSLMDLSSLSNDIENGENEKAIFIKNDSTTIVIKGNNSNRYTLPTGKNAKEINCNNGILKGVIATDGDIIIDGDVTFNGTIVCNGTLDIKNKSNVTINYDPEIVSRVQSNNEDIFKNVFGANTIYEDDNSSSNKSDQDILNTSYDLKNFLKSGLWKIEN